jgi:hypothetical protein
MKLPIVQHSPMRVTNLFGVNSSSTVEVGKSHKGQVFFRFYRQPEFLFMEKDLCGGGGHLFIFCSSFQYLKLK